MKDLTPGAALAAQRQKVPHICPVCGTHFVAIKIAVTCHNRCKQALKRQRAKDRDEGEK